jgi:PAS domain S-box-containing protein
MKTTFKILLAVILLCILAWVLDSLFDYLFFYPTDSFLNVILFKVPSLEIYNRLIASCLIIVFGLIFAKVIRNRDGLYYNLKLSEKNLSITLKSIVEGVIITDRSGIVVNINPTGEELTGYKVTDAEGKKLREIFHIQNEFTKLDIEIDITNEIKNNKPIDFANIIMVSKECKETLVSVAGSVIKDENEIISGYVISFRDINKEKKAINLLYESEQMMRAIISHTSDSIHLINENGAIIEWNKGAEKIFGLKRVEAIGKLNWEFLYLLTEPDKRNIEKMEDYKVRTLNALKSGQADWLNKNITKSVQTFTGEKIWVEQYGFAIPRKDGFWIAYINRNITERVQAEVSLKLSEEKFFKAFSMSPDVFIITRLSDGQIQDINDAFTKILGFSRDESIGSTTLGLNMWVNPEDRIKWTSLLKQSGKVDNFEAEIFDKDRNIINASISARLNEIAGEQWIVSYAKDLSSIKKIEYDLRQAYREKVSEISVKEEELVNRKNQIDKEISDREKIKKSLIESEKKYQFFFDELPIGAYKTTKDGRFISANNVLASILGVRNPEELSEYNAKEFYINSNDRDELIDKQKRIEGIVKAEYQIKRKDGAIIWVRDNGKVIHDEKGNVEYIEGVLEDITYLKLAQEALAASEEKYRKLFENLYDMFFSLTTEGEILEISPSVERILGYKSDYLIGKNISIGFNKAFINEVKKELKKSFRLINRLVNAKNKNGEDVYLSVNAYYYSDKIRNTSGVFGIARDMTTQKIAEDEINEARNYAELINRVAPSCTITVDKNGLVTSWNERTTALTGYKAEEVIGKKCMLCKKVNGKSTCAISDDKIKKPIFGKESEIITKTGEIRTISSNIDLLHNSQGDVIGGIESFEDISDRIKTEEALFLQAGVNHAIAELSKAIISMASVEEISKLILEHARRLTYSNFGIIGYFNPEKVKFEIPAMMTKGKNDSVVWDNYPVLPELNDFWNSAKAGRQSIIINNISSNESFNRFSSHYEYIKNIVSAPVIAGSEVIGLIVIGCMENDYSDDDVEIVLRMASLYSIALQRFRAENDMQLALIKEQELNELKSRFITMISHEYRTPLTAITLSKDLLMEYGDRMDDKGKFEQFHQIQQSINTMNALLDNIITYSKVEVGKHQYNIQIFDIDEYCRDIVNEMLFISRNKCIIDYSFEGMNSMVSLDENLIRQLVKNMLSNAIKFSHNNSKIKFHVEAKENKLSFTFSDEGIGIPEEDSNNIFEPFHRGNNIGTISGTGLGLSIVKNSVDILGGSISFNSEIGKGSTFFITIPLSRV